MTRTRRFALASHALSLGALVTFTVLAGCAPNRGNAFTKSMAEARRAYEAGRFEEASQRFEEASRTANVKRDAVYARYEGALARARAGDVARAATELRAIATAKPPSDYAAPAAFKAAELAPTDAERARELEGVVLTFPDAPIAPAALERILRSEDAVAGPSSTLAHLDRLAPRLDRTRLGEIVAYDRARRLADLGRTEAARDAFLDVARRFPYPFGAYFDDALYRASEMDEKLGRVPEAIAALERLLSERETSTFIGTYERPRYVPALLRIADLYEHKLHDRANARVALHRLYAEFKTSTFRDDALWREAELFHLDGDAASACDRLTMLAREFPDSRYVPCAMERCPSISRPANSKAPTQCHGYLTRSPGESKQPQPPEPSP